ncbi:integrase, catalytic region, zinc finger, CCHC-type containing protein [Tanacetum coccineum]|uniref:Integrase, catalytic region, zinc finger, CCHC-type containing protein n=1 Tax=Tanacetum coccineum TaxID=301880 RepID=A0ABQ5H4Y7_9ASTR
MIQFAPILGYGDLVQGNISIERVYSRRKRSQSNLFSVGQFCEADLEKTTSSAPICLMAKVSKPQALVMASKSFPSQLDYINLLSKKDVVIYTWTLFLHSKDETPEVLKYFLTMIQRNLQALVISVSTDRGTEFLNKTLNAFFKEEGIEHQTYTPRTPEQNSVVERR